MAKYRLVISWHKLPSIKEIKFANDWNLSGNNRSYLNETAKEMMQTLRNIKQIAVEKIE